MPARPTKTGCTCYSIRDLDANLYEKMRQAAKRRGLTVKTWLILLIEKELTANEGK